MKTLIVLCISAMVLLVGYGSPFAEKPVRGHYFESPEPILPMSFAHIDHGSVNCLDCHHNYNDGTGGNLCMNCHMTNEEVWGVNVTNTHCVLRKSRTRK